MGVCGVEVLKIKITKTTNAKANKPAKAQVKQTTNNKQTKMLKSE